MPESGEYQDYQRSKRSSDNQDDQDEERRPKRPRNENLRVELRILLPSKIAGSIIGKGGENIKRLRTTVSSLLSLSIFIFQTLSIHFPSIIFILSESQIAQCSVKLLNNLQLGKISNLAQNPTWRDFIISNFRQFSAWKCLNLEVITYFEFQS
jgi:hypothetical protein